MSPSRDAHRKTKIPEEFRRGPDPRTAEERGRHAKGRNPQKPKKKILCKTELCPRWGRGGWAKGFCKSCAYKKGYEDAQSVRKVSHHKKNQCKRRLVRFPVLNKQQHGLTDLANDETPISGQDKKNDTTKKQQDPSQMPKPPSPTEMFRVVQWPQDIFENKDDYGIEELEEEKGLGWHELSLDLQDYYEANAARQVFALMRFMATGQGGTPQEFELLSLEQKNSYDSDGDLGICGIAPTKPDVALLTCLDPGWMPWRRHSLDKMKAGVWLPDSQKATDYEDTDDDGQELEDTGAEVIM